MQSTSNTDDPRVTETMLHEQIAKVTETLPGDVRQRIMRAADDAGATAGTVLLLEILRRLHIGDDDDLSAKARQTLEMHDKGE